MVYSVEIDIANKQRVYYVGDTIEGTTELTVPERFPLSNISLSFHCFGEVKWVENFGHVRYPNTRVNYDQFYYHTEVLSNFEGSYVTVDPEDSEKKYVRIPFSFTIPKDKNLPSSMLSNDGFVKYFIRVTIQKPFTDELKKFIKEVTVQSPIVKDLMVTVGASVVKNVLLHSGTISLHASLGRKGFAPGDAITVHVLVDNRTNTKVTPRAVLYQVQIFMCEDRHKTIETVLGDEPVEGTAIEPQVESEELLTVTIPPDESLSIKSSLITVKYFVHVTLDIPQSFDMNVNLPIVVTSKKVLDEFTVIKEQPL